MNLKWILLISCLILSTYAKLNKGPRRSTNSFGINKIPRGRGRVNRRPITRISPVRSTPINSQHKPRIPSAPPLPPPPPPAPPKSAPRPKSGSRIPKPPPPSPAKQLLKPSNAATLAAVNPLVARGLLGPTLLKKINATSTNNSRPSKSGKGANNSTVQANLSLHPPPKPVVNATVGSTFSPGNSFNNTSFKNATGNGFASGNSKNFPGNATNLWGNAKENHIGKVNQTLNGNGVTKGNGFIQRVALNNTRRNFTANSSGNVNYTGNGFAKATLFNATRLTNTSQVPGNARINENGNPSIVQAPLLGQAATTKNFNIPSDNNRNYPPNVENMPWIGNTMDTTGQNDGWTNNNNNNDNQGSPTKSTTKKFQDMAKKALKSGIKQFTTKRNEKATYGVTNSLNGQSWVANNEEYSWKSSIAESPKPASNKRRNQIIIAIICISVLVSVIGLTTYFCKRRPAEN